MTSFRVIDTGIREARANIAFDQAMIDLHQRGDIPNTLRFLRFKPSALIGRHQILNHEVDVAYCRDHNIGVARRVTGGGAIYFDEGQLGWSLVFDRKALKISSLESASRRICESAALGLSRLGINATFRPRNDIEVDGRKISGTGGFFDGDTLFYQGTVLIDMDPADMMSALRIPAAKLEKRELTSASSRIVTLKELLAELPSTESVEAALIEGFTTGLGVSFKAEPVIELEERSAQKVFADEIGTDDFVTEIDAPVDSASVHVGTHTCAGGTITAYLRAEGARQDRIREVLFTGDFFIAPPRVLFDLEAKLRGTRLDDFAVQVKDFFQSISVESISVTEDDFINALATARTAVQEQSSSDTH